MVDRFHSVLGNIPRQRERSRRVEPSGQSWLISELGCRGKINPVLDTGLELQQRILKKEHLLSKLAYGGLMSFLLIGKSLMAFVIDTFICPLKLNDIHLDVLSASTVLVVPTDQLVADITQHALTNSARSSLRACWCRSSSLARAD